MLPNNIHGITHALTGLADFFEAMRIATGLKTLASEIQQDNTAGQRMVKHNAVLSLFRGDHQEIIRFWTWIENWFAICNRILLVELFNSCNHFRQELITVAAQHPSRPLLPFSL